MTIINLRLLETDLGGAGPIDTGHVIIQYWAGSRPFISVAGADTTFPTRLRVEIVGGEPVEPIDLEPTADLCCVRWDIYPKKGPSSLVRYTSIPDVEEVDFGDLPIVDRQLFVPAASPSILAALAQMVEDSTYFGGYKA